MMTSVAPELSTYRWWFADVADRISVENPATL